MEKRIKQRIYEIVERSEKEDQVSSAFDYFIILLIVLNMAAIVLESFDGLRVQYASGFRVFEYFTVAVFTIEYAMRIWTADYKYPKKHWLRAKLGCITSPLLIIDLLAILPFYLTLFIEVNFRILASWRFILRVTRLLRFIMIFKLNRYSDALKLITKVLRYKKDELFMTVVITFILLLVASTLMFYIEHDVQPDKFPNILASFWWAIATLTTVGYGDVYPITGWGRFLSGLIAVVGIGLVALPTALISSGFMEEMNKTLSNEKEEQCPTYCPHCGKKIKQ